MSATAKPQPSPRPWKATSLDETWSEEAQDLVATGDVLRISGADNSHVCGTCDGCNKITAPNAELMLRAVNHHDELVEALSATLDALLEQGHSRYCRAAESDNAAHVLCDCGLREQVLPARAVLAKVRT